MTMDWSLLLMLGFPVVYTVIIYRYVVDRYGTAEEEE